MRKVSYWGTCLLLLTVSTFTDAQQSKPHDGNWWKSLPDEQKVFYVDGFLDGISSGDDIAASQGWKPRPNAPAGCTAAKAMDFSHIRVGQLEGGLDAFYQDFRNTSIPSRHALLYVRDQITGCSDPVLGQEISILRETWTSKN
jgi:hypothetical protein